MQEIKELYQKLTKGDRVALSRAITLLESRNPRHRKAAEHLITLFKDRPPTPRIAISGPPGVGKSTFIEALGLFLISEGHSPAVLTIDPSSRRSGGSILGDRTRMEELSKCNEAFIRQTPSSNKLGGVAPHTRETILLCEQAGYDVVLIETVGVGQSEFMISDSSDIFVLLALPGSGDELQGVKKGIMEMADILVVNKADGDMATTARKTLKQLRNAIHLLQPKYKGIDRPVLSASSLEKQGMKEVWQAIKTTFSAFDDKAILAEQRSAQQRVWFEDLLEEKWLDLLRQSELYKKRNSLYDENVTSLEDMYELIEKMIKRGL
jgi:LAO/AO transport system kinase